MCKVFIFCVFLFLLQTSTCFSFVPETQGSLNGGLYVSGNKILLNGNEVKLRGVDRSGTEYACVQGWGIFDGPTDNSSIEAIKSWNTNIVRVPMNEDCWLGINGVNPQYSGYNYQQAILQWVEDLHAQDFFVILDLHWTSPGSQQATGQQPMPDTDHSIDFWSQVANAYKDKADYVIFDLFNEPYPGNGADTTQAWDCWKNGESSCDGLVSFNVSGMQQLVNSVRNTGASNLLMLGGLRWSNALDNFLQYMPYDPIKNIAASWHSYNFNQCSNEDCWNSQIAPLAATIPVIAGEIGENDCTPNYINELMPWMDQHDMHYLGWTWNTWDCGSGPALITDYNGDPTPFGAGLKQHLQSQI